MDWYLFAINDWEVYKDKDRLNNYVKFNKITQIEYQNIVGETYGE